MMLEQLKAQNFRNYQKLDFIPSPTATVILGANGSGKTSLLEAIYLLGSGKSFRTSRLQHLLSHCEEAEEFYLYAQLEAAGVQHKIGMSRNKSTFTGLRLNGETVSSLSVFAKLFPVHVFHSNSVDLIYESAEVRRRFLDWGLFHVEQHFHKLWRDLNKVVRQRNQLLKDVRSRVAEIKVWDEQLVAISAKITALRCAHLERISQYLNELLTDVLSEDTIKVSLFAGWSESSSLEQLLVDSLDVDRQRGFTSRGAHRADIKFLVNGVSAKEVLSRGQIKVFTILLGLAQLMYLVKEKGLQSLVLVDDMAAELDAYHMSYLVDKLSSLKQQVIYTALSANELPRSLVNGDGVKVFHVEHGLLRDFVEKEANQSEGNNDDR